MQEIKIISQEEGIRVDAWASSKLENCSRNYVQKLITEGRVKVNNNIIKSNYKIKIGDRIIIDIPEPKEQDLVPEDIDLKIVYEDEDIIVINKPKDMVVHPAVDNYEGTLVNALIAHCGEQLSNIGGTIRPGIVHRIDKDTSGILVVAKTNTAHRKLSEDLKLNKIKRIYSTLVQGVIIEKSGKIDAPIGRHDINRINMSVNTRVGKRAVTYFKVIERFKNATHLETRLETGRTHQIRVHMAYIGHPVIGDKKYGDRNQKYNIKGQALHAKTLAFHHPTTGEYMEFNAPLPGYFTQLLENL